MNEHQKALWQKMIDLIQSYVDGESQDYFWMVGELEGALDASECKDATLIDKWYDHWGPLELHRATHGQNIGRAEVITDLLNMKKFLVSMQQEVEKEAQKVCDSNAG